MANKKPASRAKRAPSTSTGETKVTRIKASDSSSKTPAKKSTTTTAKVTKPAETKPAKAKKVKSDKERKNVFARIGGYFAGAWYELKQVHWPDRKNSWALTIGLIVFTLIFIAIILLLDALFQYLFGLILGK